MVEAGGARLHRDGLPWWLFDMRPQGYLGRAYCQRHGQRLGLPERLGDWSDTHALRAILDQGDDMPGNLLIGATARDQFVNAPDPVPIAAAQSCTPTPSWPTWQRAAKWRARLPPGNNPSSPPTQSRPTAPPRM